MNLKQKLAKRRTGLRPNWDEHHAEKCSTINYFSDRENTELILLRQEIQIENSCINCGEFEKCKKFQEYRNEFRKMGFWTFNKHVRTWDVFDPDWSTKNRFFDETFVIYLHNYIKCLHLNSWLVSISPTV